VTREVRDFLAEVVKKPAVQRALEARLVKGDSAVFFKAVEMGRQAASDCGPGFHWPD
jgi:hypothetical protein